MLARQAGQGGQQQGGSKPRKTPRPQAVAGGLPRQLPMEPGLRAPGDRPGLVPAAVAPSLCQRARDTKQSPFFKVTQSGLFTEPPSAIWTHTARVLAQERGLEKQKVQARARMLGLD